MLTDLPEVVPLCEQSIRAYGDLKAEVVARPLPWGEGLDGLGGLSGWTHILMCDLVSCGRTASGCHLVILMTGLLSSSVPTVAEDTAGSYRAHGSTDD